MLEAIPISELVQLATGFGIGLIAIISWSRYATKVQEAHEKSTEAQVKAAIATATALTKMAEKIERLDRICAMGKRPNISVDDNK